MAATEKQKHGPQSARNRAKQINRFLWDAGEGMYFDYNFEHPAARKYRF